MMFSVVGTYGFGVVTVRVTEMLLQHLCVRVFPRVEWLVVDEADKLFEDGKRGFREQLATVFLACSCPRVRRAFFSATCTSEVEQWCRLSLDNLVCVNVGQR